MKKAIILIIDSLLVDKDNIINDFKLGFNSSDSSLKYKVINIDKENLTESIKTIKKKYCIYKIISLLYDSEKDLGQLLNIIGTDLSNYLASGVASYLEKFTTVIDNRNLIVRNYYNSYYFSNFTHLILTNNKSEDDVERTYYLNEIYGLLAKSFVIISPPEDIPEIKKNHGIIFLNCPSYVTPENFENLNGLFIGEYALSKFNDEIFKDYTFNYNEKNKNMEITSSNGKKIVSYTHPFAILAAGGVPKNVNQSTITGEIMFNKCISMGYKVNKTINN